jgi:uncharacterized repeat protein (TIGR01451 family)
MTVREFLKNIIDCCKSSQAHPFGCPDSLLVLFGDRRSVFFHFKFITICWLIFCFTSSQVFAAAGDVIGNTATIDYVYGGLPQTQESSPTGNTLPGLGNGAPTNFTEDQVVNFSVGLVNVAPVDVVTLEANAYLTFTVTNNGNAVQDFLLAAVNTDPNPFGIPPDNFNPVAPMRTFVEDGTDTSGYQPGTDTEVFIDELAAGSSATVYVVVNIPAVSAGDLAAVALVVQNAVGGAAGEGAAITNDDNNNVSPGGTYSNGGTVVPAGTPSDTPGTPGVDLVFGDAGGAAPEDVDSTGIPNTDVLSNGQHADSGAFLAQPPAVPVDPLIKTVTVIDTLGGTDPHAGATLRYQIIVNTNGASAVDNLVITDPIPANTTYTPDSITLNGVPQTDIIDPPVDYSNFDGAQIIVDLSEGGTVSISTVTTNTIVFDVTID